jgi:hypothetical protein
VSNLPVAINFNNKNVRTIQDNDGKIWFVTRDILSAITSSTTVTSAAKAVAENIGVDHVLTTSITDARKVTQQISVVSEQGFYFLIMKSTKCANLLPSIVSKITGYQSILNALNNFEAPDDLPDMYVYAIQEEGGAVKIGISRDPEQRLKQLQTGNSKKLTLVAVRKAENRYADEKHLHNLSKPYLVRGEWFDVNGELERTGLAA